MSKIKRTAIVLFNLGGPDKTESIRPFLFNLFYDKHITRLPNPLRFIISQIISYAREKTAHKIYNYIGGSSPILHQTKLQLKAISLELSKRLKEYKILIAMRYWHPLTNEATQQIKEYQPNQIILLPLYPQFSTSTTLSSINEFKKLASINYPNIPIKTICCYPTNNGFINSYSALIKNCIKDFKNTILLFSAHGLPEKFIMQGDPYQWQIEQSVYAIIRNLQIKNLNWKICYQSRIGPIKWLKPDIEKEITTASKNKKNIVVIPISFVSEHVETLVELDVKYARIANYYGVKYYRVPTTGVNSLFIKGLAKMIFKFVNKEGNVVSSGNGNRICPSSFIKCICR